MEPIARIVLRARPVVSGVAEGQALVSSESISFWGGYDPTTGEIVDRRHELSGQNAAGRVFAFPHGRGSSTASAVLIESIRLGKAPAALILATADSILSLGAIIADEMYGRSIPIVELNAEGMGRLKTGDRIRIDADGTVSVWDGRV